MSDWIIALSPKHPDHHDSAPMFWCGYVAKCHRWVRGQAGFNNAIRFVRKQDAVLSGVGGPNIPHAAPKDQPEHWPDRGVQVIEVPDLPIINPPEVKLPVDTSNPHG